MKKGCIGILFYGLCALLIGCSQSVDGVKIVNQNGQYELLINGVSTYIKGVGGTNRIELATGNGANAFRTWGGNVESIRKDLEMARVNNMYVMQGIGLTQDSAKYYDDAYKNKLREEVRILAETFKDDPNIFAWGIGNEINLHNANIGAAWSFVEELAQLIKSIDKKHLVSTVISHDQSALDSIAQYAPTLDFVGINSYGPIGEVGSIVGKSAYEGPFMITEWGPTGWWETTKTEWGAPIEQTSEEKRIVYEDRYNKNILNNKRCMGSFVFLWGQKEERTPTWFSMFVENGVEGLPLKGEKTPMVEAMQRVWTGEEPSQTAPVVKQLAINGSTFNVHIAPGKAIEADVTVKDRENDKLTYVWEILKEATITATGGAYEPRPDRVGKVVVTDTNTYATTIKEPGCYRLYIYVLDNTGFASTANIPFQVK